MQLCAVFDLAFVDLEFLIFVPCLDLLLFIFCCSSSFRWLLVPCLLIFLLVSPAVSHRRRGVRHPPGATVQVRVPDHSRQIPDRPKTGPVRVPVRSRHVGNRLAPDAVEVV